MDSEASNHIFGVKSLFQHFRKCDTGHFMRIPNDTTYHVEYVREIHRSPILYLYNVLCIPSFTVNLIAIGQLTRLNKYKIFFDFKYRTRSATTNRTEIEERCLHFDHGSFFVKKTQFTKCSSH